VTELTSQRLYDLFRYDESTGYLHWRARRGKARFDQVAGHISAHGYRKVQVDGKQYFVHRLVWLYVHGVWPTYEIDHINGVKDDNRLVNLRDIPHADNQKNRIGAKAARPDNNGKGFSARIYTNGQRTHLGYFKTAEEAQAAYVKAKQEIHGEWVGGRKYG
jgi:hypothetical protein